MLFSSKSFTTALLKRLALATVAVAGFSAGAEAQHTRYVAGHGSDAGNCALITAPCRTIQRAFQFTATGGEIRVLSSGNYGIVPLNRSVTVAGDGVTVIGGFIIDGAGIGISVSLQGLILNGVGALGVGVSIQDAAAVHIHDSTVERFTGDGVSVAGGLSTEIFVTDSVFRDNGSTGLEVGNPSSARVSIEGSHFNNNQFGIAASGSVSVARSAASGNSFSGFIVSNGEGTFSNSEAVGNGDVGFVVDSVLGPGEIDLESCVARGNANQGLFVNGTARISNSVFTSNGTGVHLAGGTILSLGDNMISDNTTDVDGTITPLAPQ